MSLEEESLMYTMPSDFQHSRGSRYHSNAATTSASSSGNAVMMVSGLLAMVALAVIGILKRKVTIQQASKVQRASLILDRGFIYGSMDC
jgi:hypothetical protein